jgi:hypothetical protein
MIAQNLPFSGRGSNLTEKDVLTAEPADNAEE